MSSKYLRLNFRNKEITFSLKDYRSFRLGFLFFDDHSVRKRLAKIILRNRISYHIFLIVSKRSKDEVLSCFRNKEQGSRIEIFQEGVNVYFKKYTANPVILSGGWAYQDKHIKQKMLVEIGQDYVVTRHAGVRMSKSLTEMLDFLDVLFPAKVGLIHGDPAIWNFRDTDFGPVLLDWDTFGYGDWRRDRLRISLTYLLYYNVSTKDIVGLLYERYDIDLDKLSWQKALELEKNRFSHRQVFIQFLNCFI